MKGRPLACLDSLADSILRVLRTEELGIVAWVLHLAIVEHAKVAKVFG